jgi:hypothetical protein
MAMARTYGRRKFAWLGLAAVVILPPWPTTPALATADAPVSVSAAVQVTVNPDPARAHSSPQIARNPKTGELVIGEAEVRTRHSCDIHISVDDGRSWFDGASPMVQPFTDCSRQATNGPYITLQFLPNGVLWAAFFGSDPAQEATLQRNDVPGRLFVARSDDSGRHWTTTVAYEGRLGDPGIGASRRGQIAVDPNNPLNVYVGWQKGGFSTPAPGGARKAEVSVSHDQGHTFGAPIELQNQRGGGQPRLVVDNKGVVHAVFAEDAFQAPSGDAAQPRPLFYTHYGDQGRTWSPLQVIDPGNVGFSFGRKQMIAVDNKTNALYVTWYGNTKSRAKRPAVGDPSTPDFDDREIFVRSSHDGGRTWSDAKVVNDDTATKNIQHYDSGISVAPNGRLDVAWYDFRNSPTPENEAAGGNGGGMNDVYWSSSADGGTTFARNVQVTDRIIDRNIGVWSNNAHSHTNLGVASSDDTVYIAWQDSRNGNAVTNTEDIYFAAVRLGGHRKPSSGVPSWLVVGASVAIGMGVTVVLAALVSRRRASAAF